MKRLLPILLLVACHRSEPKEHVAPAPASSAVPHRVRVEPALVDRGRIKTGKATRRAAAGVVRLPADVVASPEGASEAGTLLAGRIARFEAKEGDRVKPGQVLAWLDSPEAARAVADVLRARTRSETLARKVSRLQGLVASEATTVVALEEAQLDLELARADLAAGRTVIASLGIGEPPTTGAGGISAQLPVRSPVAGTLVERTAPLGAHVTPEAHLFRLVSEGRVYVEARLPDGANVVLEPGGAAKIVSHGERSAAQVLAALPQVDPATRSRRVRLLPAETAKLVPGAQVEVEIDVPAGNEPTLAVPAAAVIELKTASLVFVRTGEPGAFEFRAIEPGVRLGDDMTIRAGVTEGEDVVTDGAVLLKGELMRSELGGE